MERKKAEDLVIKRFKSLLIIANEVMEDGDVDKYFEKDETKKQMLDLINGLTDGNYQALRFVAKIKYRLGRMAKDEGVWEKEEKSVEAALKNRFEIPAEAICLEIDIRPQVKIKGLDGKLESKTLSTSLYNRRIYLMEKDLTSEEVQERYGIGEDDFVFHVREFKNSKLFEFKGVSHDVEI